MKTNLDAQMKKLHAVSMKCITAMIKKGYTCKEAEEMVIGTLKESHDYLQNGLVNETITCLEMIYLDKKLTF